MKKFLVAMGLVAFAVVGCDDSSSASAGPNDEPGVESSSSSSDKITEHAEVTSSSSSVDPVSSSSLQGDKKSSSKDPELAEGFLTDNRDGQTYKTVTIGTQTWMAENLNYADSVMTPSLNGRSWCYDNNADSCAKYGRLYT